MPTWTCSHRPPPASVAHHVEHARTHRDFPLLDLPVTTKLRPADLNRPTNQVRLVRGFALRLVPRLPAPLGRHAAEHAGFRGPYGRGADRGGRRRAVPQVGQHMRTADLDFCGLRI